MVDGTLVIGIVFFFIIWAAYFIVFFMQYCRMVAGTERLVVLATRTALFLPLYALFMLISLAKPEALAALEIPISIVEAYSFYAFFSLIVTNMGGPEKSVESFKSSGKELICCNDWMPKDHLIYYKRTVWALFHFMITRNIVVIASAIAFYGMKSGGKAVSSILSLVAAVILFYCLIHIILFYENVFNPNRNLFGILKLFLLKVSVGLIVLEGIICDLLTSFGGSPFSDDDRYSSEDKTVRGYCILVLLEYVVLVVPFLIAFTYKITPSEALTTSDGQGAKQLSFAGFVCEVLKFYDVFGTITYRGGANQQLMSSSV